MSWDEVRRIAIRREALRRWEELKIRRPGAEMSGGEVRWAKKRCRAEMGSWWIEKSSEKRRGTEKGREELGREVKSWDELRRAEMNWEELRWAEAIPWAEKSWDELRSADMSWGEPRQAQALKGWDEPQRVQESWDVLRGAVIRWEDFALQIPNHTLLNSHSAHYTLHSIHHSTVHSTTRCTPPTPHSTIQWHRNRGGFTRLLIQLVSEKCFVWCAFGFVGWINFFRMQKKRIQTLREHEWSTRLQGEAGHALEAAAKMGISEREAARPSWYVFVFNPYTRTRIYIYIYIYICIYIYTYIFILHPYGRYVYQ